eukprot:UN07523
MVKVKREIIGEDGEIEYIEEYKEETYYVDSNKTILIEKKYKPSAFDDESVTTMLEILEFAAKELLNELPDDLKQALLSRNNSKLNEYDEDFDEIQSLNTLSTIMDQELDMFSESEMKLVLEQYNKLRAPWPKR